MPAFDFLADWGFQDLETEIFLRGFIQYGLLGHKIILLLKSEMESEEFKESANANVTRIRIKRGISSYET